MDRLDELMLPLAVALAALCALRGVLTIRASKSFVKHVPDVANLLPFIGSTFIFMWDQAYFFRSSESKYGPNFRALIGGKRFHFFSTLDAVDILYRNRQNLLSVRHALGRYNLGNVESEHFTDMIPTVLIPTIARGNTHTSIHDFAPDFNRQLRAQLLAAHAEPGPKSLKHFLSHSFFVALVTAFFGDAFPTEIYEDMMLIDQCSYQLLLPPVAGFAFAARRAERRVQALLFAFLRPWRDTHGTEDMEGISRHGNDVLRLLTSSRLPPKDQAGALEAYVWAVFTNVARMSFWMLAHLLADPAGLAQLRQAVRKAVDEEFVQPGRELLDAHPAVLMRPAFGLLDSAIKETGRMYILPMSYRNVKEDVEIPVPGDDGKGSTVWVRKGDVVAANVRAMHWDARWFEDPHVFRVDRFLDGDTTRSRHLSVFGRGKNMCVGKQMANYFIKMIFIQILLQYDVRLAEGQKAYKVPSGCPRSVSMLEPNEDVEVVLVKEDLASL